MNSLKLITLPVTIILAFIILLILIHLLLRNIRTITNDEGKLKISFGIWFSALFLAGASIVTSIIHVVSEAVDNLNKIGSPNMSLTLLKTVSTVLGLGFIWFLLWYFIVKFLTKIIVVKRREEGEVNENDTSYFIIKGAIFLGIVLSLSSILELVLKLFIPHIEIPFYH